MRTAPAPPSPSRLATHASRLAAATHPEGKGTAISEHEAHAFLETSGKGITQPTYALLATLRGDHPPASLAATLRARGVRGRTGTALLAAEGQIKGMQAEE